MDGADKKEGGRMKKLICPVCKKEVEYLDREDYIEECQYCGSAYPVFFAVRLEKFERICKEKGVDYESYNHS